MMQSMAFYDARNIHGDSQGTTQMLHVDERTIASHLELTYQ